KGFKEIYKQNNIAHIETNIQESRKDYIIWMFKRAGAKNSNNRVYQFWQQDNHPIDLCYNYMMDQKLGYIQNNPFACEIVDEPIHYLYSNARDFAGERAW
ncbi:transposase, partial [Pedobacter sandarakinus]|nr:transposase [Pedobacter sandarakinus]